MRNATCKTMKYDVIFYFLKCSLNQTSSTVDLRKMSQMHEAMVQKLEVFIVNEFDELGNCDRKIQVRHVDMTEVLANIENNPETEENEEKKE